MTEPFLSIRGITQRFGGLTAVDQVSLNVERGQICSVIGPNGAGKTTLFNMLTGVYQADEGSIWLEGRELTRMPPHRIARCGVARTFQNIRLFGAMTAIENLLIGSQQHIRYTFADALLHTRRFHRAEREARENAVALLDELGLADRAQEIARHLSYGEQRRLEIARALALKPRLLLLDEPAAGMNPQETAALSDQIRAIRDRHGLTILLIEHHMQMVMGISDHVAVLDHGAQIAEGDPASIRAHPAVIEAYLGRDAREVPA